MPKATEMPAGTLYIHDWSKHFENNRTRELKKMEWVPIPNKQDGEGFTDLMSHPRGISHLGAWLCVVQVASKCDPRGTLLRRVGDEVVPYTPDTLARRSKCPLDIMSEAIVRLCEIGWLRQIPHEGAGTSHNPAPSCGEVPMEWNGTERKGMEGNGRENSCSPKAASEYTQDFLAWWKPYPRKVGKRKAAAAYARAKKRASVAELLEGSEAMSAAWPPGSDLQFCPHAETWLNQDRWTDDRSQWGPPKGSDTGKDYSAETSRNGL